MTRRFAKLFHSPRLAVRLLAALFVTAFFSNIAAAQAANDGFQAWLQAQWPPAQALGVSRAVFDAATRGLTPDLSLPDLVIPGRKEPPPRQPEFVQTPETYLKESRLRSLAVYGRQLAQKYSRVLARIEREVGVPGDVVLAIWGRETDYGRYRLPHNAIRVLATQAYLGRRKAQFQQEFLYALKILQDGHVKLRDMRSSWAGAMGHTQFLPTEFYKYAVDMDGDGRADIWNSVPDALGAAARQLAGKGWQRGFPWAIEVRAPRSFDCGRAEPAVKRPIGEWLRSGFVPADGRRLPAHVLAAEASVIMPEGTYGPAFLTPKNYFVLKDYNFSDLYVLFVGSLSDRIAGGGPFRIPWSKDKQLRSRDVEEMQRRLASLGLYKDKIDGRAGMLTRAALGAYQRANGLKLDCWPTAAVLNHMRRTGGN